MIFLANRANLDRRTLYRRIHDILASRSKDAESPVESVWYHRSKADPEEIHASINAVGLVGEAYPVKKAELQVYFDFPRSSDFDCYRIQWVEPERDFMIGWHQDETHPELGNCHLQVDFEGNPTQRTAAQQLDKHPLNVFDERLQALPKILRETSWEGDSPEVDESSMD